MNNKLDKLVGLNNNDLVQHFKDKYIDHDNNNFNINDKGELYFINYDDDFKRIPLCNFIIIPLEKIYIEKDGERYFSKYSFIGVLKNKEKLNKIEVSAEELSNYKWIHKWSGFCTIYNNAKKSYDLIKDFLFESLSNLPDTVEYSEVGWVKDNEKWIFVHSDGAIGYNDENKTIRTKIQDFNFLVDKNIDEKEAFNKTIQMLDICNRETTLPLLSYSLLSVITTPLLKTTELSPNFSMWLYGKSGMGKTSIASLFTNVFSKENLIRFESYKNVIRENLLNLKDCTFIMDDYGTSKTKSEENKMLEKMEKIIRLLGDRGLSGDSSITPNGLVLFTGEKFIDVTNSSLSSIARCIRIEMDNIFNINVKNYNEKKKLSFNYYRQNNFLQTSIYYYIHWLAEKLNDNFLKDYYLEFNKYRENFNFNHSRYVDSYAHLLIAFESYLKYGLENNFIRVDTFFAELEDAKLKLNKMIKNQSKAIVDSDVEFFLEIFSELIKNDIIKVKVKKRHDRFLNETLCINKGQLGIFYVEENKLVVCWEDLYRTTSEYIYSNDDIYKLKLVGIKVIGKKLRENLYIVDHSNGRGYATTPKTFNVNGYEQNKRAIEFNASKIPDIISLIMDKDPNLLVNGSNLSDYDDYKIDEEFENYNEKKLRRI